MLDYEDNAADASAGTGVDRAGAMYIEEGCVAWDPHSAKQCAVGIGSALKLVDTREMEITSQQLKAHDEAIRYSTFVSHRLRATCFHGI